MAYLQFSDSEDKGLALLIAHRKQDQLHAIARSIEKTAAALSDNLNNLVRKKAAVTVNSPLLLDGQGYAALLDGSRTTVRTAFLSPEQISVSIIFPADLIACITDDYYGGCITNHQNVSLDYSVMELMMLEKFCATVVSALKTGFGCHIAGVLPGIAYSDPDTSLDNSSEFQVFPVSIHVAPDTVFLMHLAVPVNDIPQSGLQFDTSRWHQCLALIIHDICVDVRAILARPVMSIQQLAKLQIGETILIDTTHDMELCLGNLSVAICKPGNTARNKAVSITRSLLQHTVQ
jgi:flagellar motor switch protein FliM